MFRSLFISFNGRSRQVLNLLQRAGPVKRCQDRSYARAAGHYSERTNAHELVEEKSSSYTSLMSFAIPTALLGAIGLASYVRYNDDKRAVAKAYQSKTDPCVCTKGGTCAKGPTIGGPFTLINTKGKTVNEQNLQGNWVLLYFGYTSSPDVGPAEVQKMAEAVEVLESSQNVKVQPVFVTLDPQRDSPSQLDAYLREFNSRIVGLTGPVNSIRQMAQEYRVFFKKVEEDGNDYLVDSSHNMYLMNPRMEIVRCFGTEYGAVDLVETISEELKKSAT